MTIARLQRLLGWGLLLVLVLIAAKGGLLAPRDLAELHASTFAGHEWQYNLYRMLAMGDALGEGMPGRWLDHFSFGWGYPLFHYTGPVPYTPGALLINFGFDPVAALNISWFLAYLGAGAAMFWACRPIFGSTAALLASACYLLAPYHLVDTYVRTNLVETSAFIFPPLMLRALWLARTESARAVATGAIGIMLLPLTHMLSTYLIGLGMAVFTLAYLALLPARERWPVLRAALLMAALGLSLAAFFWLSAVVDIRAVRGVEAITEGYYHYSNHFVYPEQLLSSQWDYGGSEIGPRDYMSFSLGAPLVVLGALAALAALSWQLRWRMAARRAEVQGQSDADARSALVLAAAIACAAMVAMTQAFSAPVWELLPGVASVQFPWRFLFPASFFLAICGAGLVALARQWCRPLAGLSGPLALLLTALVVNQHWDYARAGSYQIVSDRELTQSHLLEVGVWTTNNHEFMPQDVREIPYPGSQARYPARFLDADSIPQRSRIVALERGHGWARVQLLPGAAGRVELAQHWHPAWRAEIDGEPVETRADSLNPFAPIVVEVPADAFEVSFHYGYTTAGQVGWWLSLLALVAGLVWLWQRDERALLQRLIWPAAALLAVLGFYHYSADPHGQSLGERIEDIDTEIDSANLAVVKAPGSAWNAEGNWIFDRRGVAVSLAELSHSQAIELSVDHNDSYLLVFLSGDTPLGRTQIEVDNRRGGLAVHRVNVPTAAREQGFDRIALLPLAGDGRYSLGHLRLLNEQVAEPAVAAVRDGEHVALAALADYRRNWSPWDAPGNRIFSERGLWVELGTLSHARALALSLDSNDAYIAHFYRGEQKLGSIAMPVPEYRRGGLLERRFEIDPEVASEGFNRIRIVPVAGDGYYSLGHLKLLAR